ncbi:hypothetical protein VSR01_16185 [Actinacidiphila sp. DG2A-62]|uniref:hypothetical protein n=1 Tax=Actinacidiphila sp. DG2A-62 TaxID=3108821 RepID=UPI002DBDBC4C|nr:hypothetical protein [Actinacidiphila sp. DG2A-62]MEC3994984.1 hypothetical protein [Actinacidiphila sp. DG2A-62]
MALSPLALHQLAETVLGCVCATLDTTAAEVPGQPGCPCRACVVPGPPAWDGCTDPCGGGEGPGGQLTVHVARTYPSTAFPIEDRQVQGARGCTPPATTAVDLVVTLLRCAPTVDDTGCPPSCDELAAAAQIVHVDLTSIYNALLCCLPSTGTRRRGPQFALGQGRVLEPQGGCMGVEQRVTVALPNCGCPAEGESP